VTAELQSLKRAAIGLAVLSFVLASTPARAQTHYASGQNVVPVFEGWEKNPDGSFNMVFGYMNRNYEEQLDIPVGPNNTIEPGPPDQGQPTHFYTRRQQFAFKVRVPGDWGKKDLVWTLKVGDKTEKAYATLLPFWQLGLDVYMENRGSTAEISDAPAENEPPSIAIDGPSNIGAASGQALTLVARVTDDGRPVPRRRSGPAPVRRDSDGAVITPTGTPGPGGSGPRRENPLTQAVVRNDLGVSLGVTWIVYRGTTAGVSMSAPHAPVANGLASTIVTFSKPGTYTLRAYADDGVLIAPADVVVTVR
jgi:hypothetical protein